VSRLEDENRKLEQTIRHMIQDIETRTVSLMQLLWQASVGINSVIYHRNF